MDRTRLLALHWALLSLVRCRMRSLADRLSSLPAMNVILPGDLVLRNGSLAEGLGDGKSIRLDSSLFAEDTVVRFAREGDRIRLKDGSKPVKRLLQDMGIPSFLRNRVPVIADSDGLCAVFGRVCGGKDRICVKFITSLVGSRFPLYIVTKG